MNQNTIIIDDETTNRVAMELSREIANAIEESIQLADQGRVGEAQAVINKLCSDIRYKPMVGVIPNGNVKLTEHPVIQHYANEILANADSGQRRAKAGGEFGPNGEWYEGGKWIATTEDRIKQAPVVHEVSPEEMARRAAQKVKDDETVAHIQRWNEARKVQNKHVIDTLNFHPKDMWGDPIAEFVPNQFHLSLASQLEREGSLSPRQAEFAVKAVLGRQTKKNAEQWGLLHEQLTEDFKPGHPTFEQTKSVANASRFGEANFSIPLNGRGPWTPALKGRLDVNDMVREVHGLRIIIENAKGSLRCGYTKDGKRWEVRMPADYGFVTAVDVAANSVHPHAGRPGRVGGSLPLIHNQEKKEYQVEHSTHLDESGNVRHTFDVFDGHKHIGHAHLTRDSKKVMSVGIDAEHRGKGLASALYDHIENVIGHKLSKNWATTPDGERLWARRESANSFVPAKPGSDGDGVDCWLGEANSDQVHIIDQRDLDTKKFDEHKCFVNFASRQDAIATYLRAYSDGKAHQRIMGVRTMSIPQFKTWLQTAQTKKRASRRNFVNEETGHPFHGNQWTNLAKDPNNDPAGSPTGKLKHAVLVIGGKRYKGPSHFQAIQDWQRKNSSEDWPRVEDMSHEGFETESGHFLDRAQAAHYVEGTGQLTQKGTARLGRSTHRELDSQDMRLSSANGQLYTQDVLLAANEELTEEQQRHNRLRSHLEKIYRQELEDALFQSEQEMLAKPDDQHHLELALLALLFLLRDGLKAAGQKAYGIALNTLAPGSLQSGLPSSRTNLSVAAGAKAYSQSRAPKLENAVNKVKSTIYNSIQRGVAGGESKEALARRIREGFELVQPEIDLIAETEPQVVYGVTQSEALKLIGFEHKKWITQRDERVRHSHTLCEAQGAVPVDQPFHNGLRFPGDPNGPASEVINCRCFLLGA